MGIDQSFEIAMGNDGMTANACVPSCSCQSAQGDVEESVRDQILRA